MARLRQLAAALGIALTLSSCGAAAPTSSPSAPSTDRELPGPLGAIDPARDVQRAADARTADLEGQLDNLP